VSRAVVVGSGPNGLAAAVALAREGLDVTVLEAGETIGGGTRSAELTVPGVTHDICSAVHPMAVGSPFLRELPLERHGLEWAWPEIDLAHPLDDGSAAVMRRSLSETAAGLGADGPAWERLFGPSSRALDELNADLMRPVLHVPRQPLRLLRFGVAAAMPAAVTARVFREERTRALFGGSAAHSFAPLSQPMTSAIGAALITACHAYGWPVARGGSQAIADSLASLLEELGGTVETGVEVRSLAELPTTETVMLDVTPDVALRICGERLPPRVARAYRRYRRGPGAFKVDLAVEGGVPWRNPECGRAGTVHAAGSFAEIAAAERDVNRGRMPERPFVLVAQQHVADPTRSAGDVHPLWAYAHVPNGYEGDATDAVISQIERFAPGFRERIVATATRSPAELAAYNANYAGGDIVAGANGPLQVLFRPRVALDPYATGIPGVFICSAATPPGGGVHGMCGYGAARAALRSLGAA
jgi:phytoene dehydrogenase-like protein